MLQIAPIRTEIIETGVQHIGIPTNDIDKTVEFYHKLGFETAFETVNEEANEKVVFLKLGTLVVETIPW